MVLNRAVVCTQELLFYYSSNHPLHLVSSRHKSKVQKLQNLVFCRFKQLSYPLYVSITLIRKIAAISKPPLWCFINSSQLVTWSILHKVCLSIFQEYQTCTYQFMFRQILKTLSTVLIDFPRNTEKMFLNVLVHQIVQNWIKWKLTKVTPL